MSKESMVIKYPLIRVVVDLLGDYISARPWSWDHIGDYTLVAGGGRGRRGAGGGGTSLVATTSA
jgi:hypothetical protein